MQRPGMATGGQREQITRLVHTQSLVPVVSERRLRLVALRKMEGYTNEEVAAQVGCAPATVERRLRLIRKRWKAEIRA